MPSVDLKFIKTIKTIYLFVLLNSSIYLAIQLYWSNGPIRLIIIALMNISVFLLIRSMVRVKRKEFDVNLYFKIIFSLLLLWSVFTIFRSFALNSKDLISLFGHTNLGWAWITPLAVVLGLNINNWLYLFDFFTKIILISAVLAVGSAWYSLGVIFGLIEWMWVLPILIMTYIYQKKSTQRIIIFASIMFLLLSFYGSQRANFVFLAMLLLFSLIEYYRQPEVSPLKKVILFYVLVIGLLLFSFKINSIVSDLSNNQEITEDTRTFLVEEMYEDMDDTELLVGRGALGTYFSPYFYYLRKSGFSGGDSATRVVNELGYLEIVLKGGYVMVALYILFLLPAAYLGIFKSKNILSRTAGYYILVHILFWFITYMPIYSPKFILLWMAAGSTISKRARNTKNSELLIFYQGKYQFKSAEFLNESKK
jgi:hypothetical protein